jgi:hypothetical protein
VVRKITFNGLGDGCIGTVTLQTNVPPMLMSPEAQAGLETASVEIDDHLSSL